MKMEFLKTRFALSLAAAILVAAQIGGCGTTAEPTSEVTSLADARTISARPDGRFDVVCQDGTQETITEDQLRANDVCNSASPVEPAPTPPFVTELPDRQIYHRESSLRSSADPIYHFSADAAESISFTLKVVSNQARIVDGHGQAWSVSNGSGEVPFFSLRTPVNIYHSARGGRHSTVNFSLSDIKIHRSSPLAASVSLGRPFTTSTGHRFPLALGLVEGYVSFNIKGGEVNLSAGGQRLPGENGAGYSRYEMVKLPVTLSAVRGSAASFSAIRYYITRDVVLGRERITTKMAPSHIGAPGAQTWPIADQNLAYSGRKLTFSVDVKFFNNFLSNECTVVKFGDSVFNHAQTSATVSVTGTVQAKIESICATSRLENPENRADIEVKTKLIAVGGLPQ